MTLEQGLVLAGRVIMGGYFAFTGLNHFLQDDSMSGWIEAKGYPMPEVLNYFAGGLLLMAGLDLILGTFPATAWGALTLFLVVASIGFHDFWNLEGEERQNHMTHFLKNLGLIGGLAFFAVLVAQGDIGPVALEISLLT